MQVLNISVWYLKFTNLAMKLKVGKTHFLGIDLVVYCPPVVKICGRLK